ncbi:MAG: type IV pilus modification PilV family protein [bacterium]
MGALPCNKHDYGHQYQHPEPARQRIQVRAQQGFSLLEILVAFVIMGLVVGGILQLFGSSMRSVALSEEYSYAVQLAESKMALVGTEFTVETGTQSGQTNDKYQWAINFQPTEFTYPDGAPPARLFPYQVAVVITWQSGSKTRQYQLDSLRFGDKP